MVDYAHQVVFSDWRITLLVGVLLVWAIWVILPRSHNATLLKRFGLSESDWTVIGEDMGNRGKALHVKGFGLCGTPDFVVQNKHKRVLKVYDYKHRAYRKHVRPYERYQVILYACVLKKMRPGWEVLAGIKYKDAVVDIAVDEKTFQWLLTFRDPIQPYL